MNNTEPNHTASMIDIIEKLKKVRDANTLYDWSLEEQKELLELYYLFSKNEPHIFGLIYGYHGCDSYENIFRDYNLIDLEDKACGVKKALDKINSKINNSENSIIEDENGSEDICIYPVKYRMEVKDENVPNEAILDIQENKRKYRSWKNDRKCAEEFCKTYEQYGLCYLDTMETKNVAKYYVFFEDTDGDEIQCCLAKHRESYVEPDLLYYDVMDDDIVLFIPLNELDMKTDVFQKLLDYCVSNNIIEHKTHQN